MNSKQKLATILAVLLVLLQSFPAFAVETECLQEPTSATITQDSGTPPQPSENPNKASDVIPEDGTGVQPTSDAPPTEAPIMEMQVQGEMPVFSVELVEEGENPGLYGTLSYIPKNTIDIAVEYSFGGESYYFVENSAWKLHASSPDTSPLTQLCMKLDSRQYTAWQSGAVNSLSIRLHISCDGSADLSTESVVFSHQTPHPIPETPPPFAAEVVYSQGGYQVDGNFEDFPPDVVRLRPMYSLDGQEYKAVNELYPRDWCLEQLGTADELEKHSLEHQCCITYDEEPLASYVAGKLDRFYILLEITTESGVYRTQSAVIERGSTKPIPQGTHVKAAFPFTMRPLNEWGGPMDVLYGQYQITVREGATAQQIRPLLPATLPIEVQLWQEHSAEMVTSGIVQVPATWKALSLTQLTAGNQVILSDAAEELVIPSGTEVATPLGNFLLNQPVTFDGNDNGQVRLVIDVVGRDEAPAVSLRQNSYENSIDDIGALSLAFRLKPSGATAITAYTLAEGDEGWTELCDLLARRDLNHNQAMGIYGFVTLLQPEAPPFLDYLKNGAPFLIGIKIVGGTFDGEKVVLPWPGDYTPPAGIPEPGGSEGNGNNAGSGGGDSTDEGQRPDLPEESEPPSIVAPPTEGNPQLSEQVPPPNLLGITAPEQLQLHSGGTEKPAAGEQMAVADLSQLPQLDEEILAERIQKGQTDENETGAGQRLGSKAETQGMNVSLPMAVSAAIILVCGGITAGVGAGTTSGAVSVSGFWGRLLDTLRKLFS